MLHTSKGRSVLTLYQYAQTYTPQLDRPGTILLRYKYMILIKIMIPRVESAAAWIFGACGIA